MIPPAPSSTQAHLHLRLLDQTHLHSSPYSLTDSSGLAIKTAALCSASALQTSVLTATRGRPVGSYGTTWSFPLLHNGYLRSCRVGQRKVKKTPCNSLFKHDLIRPTLAPRKHVLTCANRTDLVIHDPHRPDGPHI